MDIPSFFLKISIDVMYFQKCDTTKFVDKLFSGNKQKAIFAWKIVIFMLYTCYHFVNGTELFYSSLNLGIFLYSTSLLFLLLQS